MVYIHHKKAIKVNGDQQNLNLHPSGWNAQVSIQPLTSHCQLRKSRSLFNYSGTICSNILLGLFEIWTKITSRSYLMSKTTWWCNHPWLTSKYQMTPSSQSAETSTDSSTIWCISSKWMAYLQKPTLTCSMETSWIEGPLVWSVSLHYSALNFCTLIISTCLEVSMLWLLLQWAAMCADGC